MSVIYMEHPQHGRKVAIAEEEAVLDEQNGWIRYSLTADVSKAPAGVLEFHVKTELDEAKERYKARFGKAPHHKKSLETLKAELAA